MLLCSSFVLFYDKEKTSAKIYSFDFQVKFKNSKKLGIFINKECTFFPS